VEELVVVSRDVHEFVEACVPVLNPWIKAFSAPGQPQKTLEGLARGDLLEVISQI
jgi:hypothetical protein